MDPSLKAWFDDLRHQEARTCPPFDPDRPARPLRWRPLPVAGAAAALLAVIVSLVLILRPGPRPVDAVAFVPPAPNLPPAAPESLPWRSSVLISEWAGPSGLLADSRESTESGSWFPLEPSSR